MGMSTFLEALLMVLLPVVVALLLPLLPVLGCRHGRIARGRTDVKSAVTAVGEDPLLCLLRDGVLSHREIPGGFRLMLTIEDESEDEVVMDTADDEVGGGGGGKSRGFALSTCKQKDQSSLW